MKWIPFLFVLTCLQAQAKETFHLQGTLGEFPIYMYFDDYTAPGDNEISEARYFYRSSLKDIVLEGEKTPTGYTFYFDKSENGFQEKFVLNRKGAGQFEGTWQGTSGKTLPVKLSPLQIEPVQNAYARLPFVQELRQGNPVDYVRLSFITLKRDSTTMLNGKSIVWFSESHCVAPFFRLGNGFTPQELNLINPILDRIHLDQILAQLTCSSRWSYNDGGNGIDYSTTVDYLDGNLLGFYVFSSWFCGGAHPDFGGVGYLIDLHNGREYEVDDVIAFHPSVTTQEKGGFDAYSKYREEHFAPRLVQLLTDLELIEAPESEEDACDYTDVEYWNFVGWRFTPAGIEFTPFFYRAARSCEEPFLVPFSELHKYKHPDFPYPLPR